MASRFAASAGTVAGEWREEAHWLLTVDQCGEWPNYPIKSTITSPDSSSAVKTCFLES